MFSVGYIGIVFGQTANLAKEQKLQLAIFSTISCNLSMVFGLIWGLMVFNIDRFIVATGKGDGSEAQLWVK